MRFAFGATIPCYKGKMRALNLRAFIGLVMLVLVMAAGIFGTAGTLHYWQGWLFLICYFSASIVITLYLARRDPALLERRMRGGPWAEKEPTQKVIMSIASAGFVALLMLLGIPISLGSWWGVLVLVTLLPAMIWRLLDEERFLGRNLPGYVAYQDRVRYRLLPRVW